MTMGRTVLVYQTTKDGYYFNHRYLYSKGDVYTCGYGEDGQLGYVWHEHDDIYNAKKADVRPTVKKVSCGSISTLCLSTYGDIWACGANDVWQGFLGVDSDDDCVCSPMKIGVSDNIKDIVSTWGAPNTYAAVDDVGLVFCWGKNRNPVQLDNVSSVFEVGQNGRASLDLESICFPINHCRSSSIQPLALQEESQNRATSDPLHCITHFWTVCGMVHSGYQRLNDEIEALSPSQKALWLHCFLEKWINLQSAGKGRLHELLSFREQPLGLSGSSLQCPL
ncbi:unnamed protein product, partial [Nesidiocoris tenuis]